MKKIVSYAFAVATAMALTVSFASCSDDNGGNGQQQENEKNALLEGVTQQYINKVVFPTYTNLANSTEELFGLVQSLQASVANGSVTETQIQTTCDKFLEARAWWEKSEAWLYGPAEVFGIDPHIDTWPLSRADLGTFFATQYASIFESGKTIDQQIAAVSALNDETSSLGFHGLEFILFRNGAPRTTADLLGKETDADFAAKNPNVTGAQELKFAIAVAGDLYDHCCWLEAAWLGTQANPTHVARCTNRGFELLIDGAYTGDAMLTLNKTQSYTSWRGVISTILDGGCMNICDEVANSKMGQVYRCAIGRPEQGEEGPDSPDYIESPYSKKSFEDFYDNIISIKNALYGNLEQSNYDSKSVIAYLYKYNPTVAAEVQTKLDASLSALTTCKEGSIKFVDFANNHDKATELKIKAAMDAINELNDAINEAKEWIQKN